MSEILKSLQKVHEALEPIAKGRKSPQGYAFRGIDDILEAVHPLFVKHNIILGQEVVSTEPFVVQQKSGEWPAVTIRMRYTLTSTVDGSEFMTGGVGCGADNQDKSGNKAMANALKYALFYLFLNPPRESALDSEAAGAPESHPPARSTAPVRTGAKKASAPAKARSGGAGDFEFRFGKHKGRAMSSIDTDYLEWITGSKGTYGPDCGEGKYGDANLACREAILSELGRRGENEEAPASAPEGSGPVDLCAHGAVEYGCNVDGCGFSIPF